MQWCLLLEQNLNIMNATQPSRPPLQPVTPRRVTPRPGQRPQRQLHRAIAIEITAKLTVNVVLSIAAVSALVQLLPYHLSRQEKLREIRAEVRQTETRVNHLQTSFSRYFDPQQAKSIMQEESSRIDPKQRKVVWLDNSASDTEESKQQP